MEYKQDPGGESMVKIVGKLRCPVCSKIVRFEDKVILNDINTITHQECYYQLTAYQLPIKDKGSFKKILLKYPFLQ
jgi:hypothetical protein